jgi:hypothetical protein
MLNHTPIEQIQLLCRELAGINSKIRTEANTRKTKGTHYPIRLGYSTAARRPVRDILKWMDLMEETLALIVVELEDK